MTIQSFLARLESVKNCGHGRWSAKCPSHSDRSPSLSICEAGTKILLHCFAGCESPEIVVAMGLRMADLFSDSPITPGHRPTSSPPRIHLDAVAFKFELAALDRRLRAERVSHAIRQLEVDGLSDHARRRITHAQQMAEADNEHAQLLEQVADDLRWKTFTGIERNPLSCSPALNM